MGLPFLSEHPTLDVAQPASQAPPLEPITASSPCMACAKLRGAWPAARTRFERSDRLRAVGVGRSRLRMFWRPRSLLQDGRSRLRLGEDLGRVRLPVWKLGSGHTLEDALGACSFRVHSVKPHFPTSKSNSEVCEKRCASDCPLVSNSS